MLLQLQHGRFKNSSETSVEVVKGINENRRLILNIFEAHSLIPNPQPRYQTVFFLAMLNSVVRLLISGS